MSTSVGDHDRWADSLAPWLLGALAEDEAQGFAAHLEQCTVCREDAAALRVATDALPTSAPPLPAPPELKQRIMAVVERESELLTAAGERAPQRPEPARRAWMRRLREGLSSRPPLVLAGTLAVLVLVGAGLLGQSLLSSDVRTLPATIDRSSGLTATQAELEVGNEEARFVTRKLPAPPQGRVYQLWIDRDGRIDPTKRLFMPRDGSASVELPGSMRGVRQVMVTDEPAGGSAAPTGRPIISVEPA
jgi:Anti-sigma-K factor rskA